MKATGIIRRIDDLGRFVIPKEIRRTLRLSEGDPLEIYTSDHEQIILKKYSALLNLDESSLDLAKILSKSAGCPVLIADTDRIVASWHVGKGAITGQLLSETVRTAIQNRKQLVQETDEILSAAKEIDLPFFAAVPVASSLDIWGAVILLKPDENKPLGEREIGLAQFTADVLAGQMKS